MYVQITSHPPNNSKLRKGGGKYKLGTYVLSTRSFQLNTSTVMSQSWRKGGSQEPTQIRHYVDTDVSISTILSHFLIGARRIGPMEERQTREPVRSTP